ncbi:MAG: di-heme oxidoredictase family protein, partial [Longimicrobiales bacterium]
MIGFQAGVRRAALALGLSAGLASCDLVLTEAPDAADVLDGPVAGLTLAESRAFALGDERFEESFAASLGLGPIFNNVSCASCHSGDGRGRPQPEFSNVVLRMDAEVAVALGEGSATLERRAIPGAEPEEASAGAALSRRLPPPVFGLGLIEAIPVATILALADPEDADGDGVSGRPHWVTAAPWVPPAEVGAGPGPQLGRFTRKARVSSILEQVADAYHKDMGITSDFLPAENDNRRAVVPTLAMDGVADPEIPAEVVQQVAFYVRTLAPPAAGPMTARRQEGRAVFTRIGCAACHVPELRTGAHRVAALAGRPVQLYS